MNDVQAKISELKSKGWTLAALASELDMHWNTVNRWDKGTRFPDNPKPVLMALDTLLQRKRIPKRKRYAPGSRTKTSVSDEQPAST